MLSVYDRSLRKRAVLDLAYKRKEKEVLNGVGELSFSLPADDPKAEKMTPFSFVRDEDGGAVYRLLLSGMETRDTGERRYTAEHAIATLVDDVMFGTHIIGGLGIRTRDVIEYILGQQTVRHWRLGACEFDKQFEYGFESENLLNALFSVPNLFIEKYRWVFDFTNHPFTVSLLKIEEHGTPDFYIRAGKNLIASKSRDAGADICTRLYLLGYGEGDNQLRISDINGGKPYLESPQPYIDRYGLISKVYVDRQFEDAESLMERGRALLAAMQDPPLARSFKVADLYEITNQRIDRAEAGDRVLLTEDGTEAFVKEVVRNADSPGDMTIELSTASSNIAADIADIADRQRIEQVYSQGATQIYGHSIQANADKNTQAVLNFYIPREMRIVNKVAAKISIESFRSYNRVTSGGGGSASTSSSGGGGSQTSDAGGGFSATSGPSTKTTVAISSIYSASAPMQPTGYWGGLTGSDGSGTTGSAGGGYTGSDGSGTSGSNGAGSTGSAAASTSNASAANTGATSSTGSHYHSISHTHTVTSHSHSVPSHTHSTPSHAHSIPSHYHSNGSHTHTVPSHQHSVQDHAHYIDHSHDISHTHTVSVNSHTHSVSIPSHSHSVSIPDHSHGIEQGIFRFGSPSGAGIYVNGSLKFTMEKEYEVDLTPYLLNASGKIPRGSWIRLGVLPNDLAYITIDIYIQGFVQSRGGGTY